MKKSIANYHEKVGQWYVTNTAPCPICQPEKRRNQNALTIHIGQDGDLVLYCEKRGCASRDILSAVGMFYWQYARPDVARLAQCETKESLIALKRAVQVMKVWIEAFPIAGTVAETYLRGRGITSDLGQALRFHPKYWHGPTAKHHPAILAAVQGASLPAVHCTYLRADGTGNAGIYPTELLLGAATGGAVRLTEATGPLVVAKGMETAMSLASGLLRSPANVWAALSTSGIRRLRLPNQPGRLTIAPDGDKAGLAAANALAVRALALGWQVSLLPAPDGRDWNDILTMKGTAA